MEIFSWKKICYYFVIFIIKEACHFRIYPNLQIIKGYICNKELLIKRILENESFLSRLNLESIPYICIKYNQRFISITLLHIYKTHKSIIIRDQKFRVGNI